MAFYEYLRSMMDLALEGDKQGLVFWIAAYLLVVGALSLSYQLRVRTWPSTVGQLLDLGLSRFGGAEMTRSNQEYLGAARYRYEVGGKGFTGTRISSFQMVASHNARAFLEWQLRGVQRLADGAVVVYYNPRKPQRSYLIIPGVFGVLFTAAITVVPMGGYLWHYHG